MNSYRIIRVLAWFEKDGDALVGEEALKASRWTNCSASLALRRTTPCTPSIRQGHPMYRACSNV